MANNHVKNAESKRERAECFAHAPTHTTISSIPPMFRCDQSGHAREWDPLVLAPGNKKRRKGKATGTSEAYDRGRKYTGGCGTARCFVYKVLH